MVFAATCTWAFCMICCIVSHIPRFAAAREIRGYLYLRQSALEHHFILAARRGRERIGVSGGVGKAWFAH
jgi:hypothetical protein